MLQGAILAAPGQMARICVRTTSIRNTSIRTTSIRTTSTRTYSSTQKHKSTITTSINQAQPRSFPTSTIRPTRNPNLRTSSSLASQPQSTAPSQQTVKPGEEANFWIIRPGTEDAYWSTYETTRPRFSDSGFLDTIYAYHARKPGTAFSVAHDVAAGAGHAGHELAATFSHVVVSDESESSVAAARRRLERDGLSAKTSCVTAPAEELWGKVEAASADLIVCAESIPIMDIPKALTSWARVLKPNGTVAVWFYGQPVFTEERFAKECNEIYAEIMDRTFAKVINGGGEARTDSWQRAVGTIHSWLDNVDMTSSGLWKGVERWRWNEDRTYHPGMMGHPACDFTIKTENRVAESETRMRIEDPTFWKGTWKASSVRTYVEYTFPNIGDLIRGDPKIEAGFEKLTKAMGGPEAERDYTIACALILATRSDKPVK